MTKWLDDNNHTTQGNGRARVPGYTSFTLRLTPALTMHEASERLMQAMGNSAFQWVAH